MQTPARPNQAGRPAFQQPPQAPMRGRSTATDQRWNRQPQLPRLQQNASPQAGTQNQAGRANRRAYHRQPQLHPWMFRKKGAKKDPF